MVFEGGPVAADVPTAVAVTATAVASAARRPVQGRRAHRFFVEFMSYASFRREKWLPGQGLLLPGGVGGMRLSCKNEEKRVRNRC
jgi:hypothetical protein